MRDCASQEVFQSWPRWDSSEDADKEGENKPCFDLTPPVNIREKQSLENPSPQNPGSLVGTENNTLLMSDQESSDLI